MTNILLIVLGVLIGLIVQAALDFKVMNDLERDVDNLQENYDNWLEGVKRAMEAADGKDND